MSRSARTNARDEAVLALEVLGNALLLENHQRVEKRKSNDQDEIEQPVHPAIGPVRIECVGQELRGDGGDSGDSGDGGDGGDGVDAAADEVGGNRSRQDQRARG